jgi:SSS family solute:Na+ symporter
MLYIGWDVSQLTGGVVKVIEHAAAAGKFSNFMPQLNVVAILGFAAALVTMMLGSIPQQDVFQRVASSRDEKTAGRASVLGGCMYFCFAFIPMFLAYSATLIDPEMTARLLADPDSKAAQHILPNLILNPRVPLIAQIMFFGALLSAIKSCASATLLAPSVSFTENILRPAFKHMGDKQLLRMMRVVVFCFTCLVTVFAIYSQLPIYKMVENAYKVTLVAAFVPLAFGLYWKHANTPGALSSILLGLSVWIGAEIYAPDGACPPQLAGLFASLAGMIVGSLLPKLIGVQLKAPPHRAHVPAVPPHATHEKRGSGPA